MQKVKIACQKNLVNSFSVENTSGGNSDHVLERLNRCFQLAWGWTCGRQMTKIGQIFLQVLYLALLSMNQAELDIVQF